MLFRSDDMLLIDRINLYFKVGFQCGVKFTPEEKQFVNRAERCESIDDVITLAQEIYAYAKEQAEQKKKEREANGETDIEDEEDGIHGDFDIDMDGDWEQEESDDNDLNPFSQRGSNKHDDSQADEEQELEAKTDRAFQQKLEDLADDSTEYHYWKFDNEYFEDPVIGYKTILNETKSPSDWELDQYQYDYKDRKSTRLNSSH